MGLKEGIGDAAVEDRGGPAEPDIGLRVCPFGAQPVEDLLAPHVEPAEIDVRMAGLEGPLEQLELVPPVRRVEHHRRPPVCPATGGEEREEQRKARRLNEAKAKHEGSGG